MLVRLYLVLVRIQSWAFSYPKHSVAADYRAISRGRAGCLDVFTPREAPFFRIPAVLGDERRPRESTPGRPNS